MNANTIRAHEAAKMFKAKSNKIHNNKYDYSMVQYLNNKTKVNIICSMHGNFQQTPNNHLNGNGCPRCKNEKTKHNNSLRTQEDILARTSNFIQKSTKIHKNKYDYSNVNYVNAHTAVNIICQKHGIFSQLPSNHLNNRGCPKCGIDKLVGGYNEKLFEDNPNFKQIEGYIYLVVIRDKIQKNSPPFIKIGITVRKPKYRLSKLKNEHFIFTSILERKMLIYDAFKMEQEILQKYKSERFFPCRKFQGYTECMKYRVFNDIQEIIKRN